MGLSLLLSNQRAGSNFLRKLLESHPDAHCYPELFHTDAPEHDRSDQFEFFEDWLLARLGRNPKCGLPSHRAETAQSYLDEFWDARENEQGLVDIKWNSLVNLEPAWSFPGQIPALLDWASQRGVAVVWLRRRALLRQVISFLRASSTDTGRCLIRSRRGSSRSRS